MPNTKAARLVVEIAYDPDVTTPEKLCETLDALVESAISPTGMCTELLEGHGQPDIYSFEVLDYDT